MTSQATFWDKAAPKYATSKISDMEGYHHTLERTRAHLSSTDRVLELGCGTASTALELAGDVAHITATDMSPVMVEIGRRKATDAGTDNITVLTGVAGDTNLAQGAPYDVILAFNLLHLLPNQAEALIQIHGMLKPGGLLISKTVCLGERWFFRPLIAIMTLFGKAPYVMHQRQKALRNAILGAGFEVVEELDQPGTVPRLYMVAKRA